MTSYEAGFLTKCASSGVPEEAAYYLLKFAIDYQYAKPGYDIFGRPLSAPVPTEQQKADAAAAGISTPATAAPRPVSRRQTAASPLGAPDPVNPYGVRGTSTERKADPVNPPAGSGLTASPAEAGVPKPKPFQPNVQQQKLQAAWDKMTPQGQAKNLGRIGITQEQFDAYSPQQKYDAMDRMRSAWMKAKQNAGAAAGSYSSRSGVRGIRPAVGS